MESLTRITGLGAGAVTLIACAVALLIGLVVGWTIARIRTRRAERERERLALRLEAEQRLAAERQHALEHAGEQLRDSFSHLSREALRKNNEQFLQLADVHLKKQQGEAQTELDKRQTAIRNMLDPIREALQKNEKQIREIEKERKESYGSISKYLEYMESSQKALRSETRNLVQALRRPEVRGQWGEIQLKRLVELAGMQEHCDFDTQVSLRTAEGVQRPDMVVHLPENRQIVVDAKTPTDAYMAAVQSEDRDERARYFHQHLRQVRERVEELSRKSYWSQFEQSPEMVVLFIPGEQYLAAALDLDPKLLEHAMSRKVIIASPTSLMGVLKMMAHSWRQVDLMENAENIRRLGVELYDRVATFSGHLGKLSVALNRSVNAFNSAVGSLQSRVLPSVQRFRELGITSARDVDPPEQVETPAREVESPLRSADRDDERTPPDGPTDER